MQRFRVWWNSFKTVALLMSFITNLVLLVVVLLLLMQIFQIKNGILEPLIDGLHSNFVGMDEAVINRTIEVEDEIPVVFDLPLNQTTTVVLTQDVPIAANATFTLPGGGGVINGRVDIVLPKDLVLPVQLSMIVPVNTNIPINLPVDVTIPLSETELHAPFVNLRDLLEPYVRLLDNLPSDWSDVPDFTINAIQGEGENLLRPSPGSQDPWPGPYEGKLIQPESPGDTTSESQAAGDELGEATGEQPTSQPDGPPGPTVTPVQDIGIIPPASQ